MAVAGKEVHIHPGLVGLVALVEAARLVMLVIIMERLAPPTEAAAAVAGRGQTTQLWQAAEMVAQGL